MEKQYVKINIFDDGRNEFKAYTNKWVVIDKKFNGGKLVLKNAKNKKVIINSISAWKTEPYVEEMSIK